MRKAKALYSGYSKGVGHHHLNSGRDSKAGRGMGKLYRRHSRRLQVCPDWRLWARGRWRWANETWRIRVVGQRSMFDFPCLVLRWKQGQKSGKLSGMKSSPHPLGANGYRSYCWVFWIVTGDGNLASCKSGF